MIPKNFFLLFLYFASFFAFTLIERKLVSRIEYVVSSQNATAEYYLCYAKKV